MTDPLREACERLVRVAEEYREMGRDLPLLGAADQLAELEEVLLRVGGAAPKSVPDEST